MGDRALTNAECRALRDRWRTTFPAVPRLWETVNSVTPVPAEVADTFTTGEQYRTPLEDKQMFPNSTFESRTTAVIAALLVLSFVASLVCA